MVSGSGGKGTDLLAGPLALELLAAPLIATLATTSTDGAIHLVPMWFMWDGQAVLIPTHHATRKVRNLERVPRATVMIDDSRRGLDLRGLTIAGEVTITTAPDSFALNRKIHLKYVSQAERDLPAVDAYLGQDDVTIQIRPQKVFQWDLRSSPAGIAFRT